MGAKKSKTSLETDELDYIMKHTDLNKSTIKEWYSGFLRDCPSGKMTQEQFYQMYKMLIPKGNTKKFSKHVFRTFDTDNNNYIDFLEFLLAVNITSSGNPEEKLKWTFKLYDVDGNGTISQQEMTKVVQSVYDIIGSNMLPSNETAKERAEKVFSQLDTDGDSKLTEDEFVQGCMKSEELKCLLTPAMVNADCSKKNF